MKDSHGCPCGSQRPLEDCCQPLLNGQTVALTAEQLMRSRFTAFCSGDIDYLIATHHPSKHHSDDRQQFADSMQHCQWLDLKIVDVTAGQAGDSEGQVEFIARYQADNQLQQLHERSRFVKENNRWLYLDGELFDSRPVLPGRNEPCWCGSGKKFKKCHG